MPTGNNSKNTHKRVNKALPLAPEKQIRTITGEEQFNLYCSTCHPDGGNVSDPQRNLRSSSLRKNNISTRESIVNIMRHPTSLMIRFDETTLPDKDAKAIADYILKSFQ